MIFPALTAESRAGLHASVYEATISSRIIPQKAPMQ